MESPHHGALDPGSHPRTATEAAHSGAYGHCNTIQMYTTVRVDVFRYACTGWEYTHMFPSLRVWECANEGSMQIKIFPASLLSVCLRGSGYFHYCRKIHSNPQTLSANDMQSQRTLGFNSEGH